MKNQITQKEIEQLQKLLTKLENSLDMDNMELLKVIDDLKYLLNNA